MSAPTSKEAAQILDAFAATVRDLPAHLDARRRTLGISVDDLVQASSLDNDTVVRALRGEAGELRTYAVLAALLGGDLRFTVRSAPGFGF